MTVRYPIYILSKGRAGKAATTKVLERLPFSFVVEPSQAEAYTAAYPDKPIIVLPKDGGGIHYAREWVMRYNREAGAAYHWQFDDDVAGFRLFRGAKVEAAEALAYAETFPDRFERIGMVGFHWPVFGEVEGLYPFVANGTNVGAVMLVSGAVAIDLPTGIYPEDMYMNFAFHRLGYDNVVVTKYIKMMKEPMGKPGDTTNVTFYAYGEVERHRLLLELFPEYCHEIGGGRYRAKWKNMRRSLRLRSGGKSSRSGVIGVEEGVRTL